MDRSQQGVVPRTCLSKNAVKPRPPPNQQPPRGPGLRGSPPRGMNGPPPNGPLAPQPLTPTGGSFPRSGPPNGRNSPGPSSRNSPGSNSRPMTPTGHGFPPAPFGNASRPQSSGGQAGRTRSGSVPRSMSPGPAGSARNADQRRRSNSMSNIMSPNAGSRRNSPPGMSPLGQGSMLPVPTRKPVPGQGQ